MIRHMLSSLVLVSCLTAVCGAEPPPYEPIQIPTPPDQAFADMERKIDAMSRPRLPAKFWDDLARKKVAAHAWREGNGQVGEWSEALYDVPLETFLKRMPARNWGINLATHVGGSVRRLDPAGGAERQVERMKFAAPGRDLDMTKIETIRHEYGASGELRRAVVRWEVVHSDNGTVKEDIGSVRFEAVGPHQTRVRFHSRHKLNKFPLLVSLIQPWITAPWLLPRRPDGAARVIVERLIAKSLARSFKGFLQGYRPIAMGRRPAIEAIEDIKPLARCQARGVTGTLKDSVGK